MENRTIYCFENKNKLYNRVMKQLDLNRCGTSQRKLQKHHHHHQEQSESQNEHQNEKQNQHINPSNQRGNYVYQCQLRNPKSQIRTKSIYTQEESQYFVNSRLHQEDNQEDIYKFIEHSKTLREKINQKLDKKKKNQNKIIQTTFRPKLIKDKTSKQNKVHSNLSNRKSFTKQQYPKCGKVEKKIRVRTEIDEANALWDKKCDRTISKLDFYQRQQKTLTDRRQVTKKLLLQKQQKEMEGCTFKPKLTKYKPKRT